MLTAVVRGEQNTSRTTRRRGTWGARMSGDCVRIGCFSAFWGDTPGAATQLVESGEIDFLVGDYLAEVTMSLLAKARTRRPEGGFISDFVRDVYTPLLASALAQNIRILTNAGGLDPVGLQAKLEAEAARMMEEGSLSRLPVVAVVYGDELDQDQLAAALHAAAPLVTAGVEEPLPHPELPIMSANVYFGAQGLAAALDAGADVVVTGRCVDSALVLAPLVHAFGWSLEHDLDKLSAGCLAGHIIECGAQCTGGNFTDWESVAASWDSIGFPIAHVWSDGSLQITKPAGTGGIVSVASVAEQILYEIGDPGAYILPDVVCDWRNVTLTQVDHNVVSVQGARGTGKPGTLKLGITQMAGFRSEATLLVPGLDASRKASAVGKAILARVSRVLASKGFGPFTDTRTELLGGGVVCGPGAWCEDAREVVLRIAVKHPNPKALVAFAKEIAPAATGMAPGISAAGSGRPRPMPCIQYTSALVPPMSLAPLKLEVGGGGGDAIEIPWPQAPAAGTPKRKDDQDRGQGQDQRWKRRRGWVKVPLIAVAHARSGDKGDAANIGVIARSKELYPLIRAQVTVDVVRDAMAHVIGPKAQVVCYQLPGLSALNFLLACSLGGGGISSLNLDRQGKTYAQALLSRVYVYAPRDLVSSFVSKL